MTLSSTARLAGSPMAKSSAGYGRKREKSTLSGSDQQTKLNLPILRTFFRKAKGSCYYLRNINAGTATQEGKRVSITANPWQTGSLLGRQFGPVQVHVLPFILMQRENLRGLSLVAYQHPSLLLIENKSFACSCLPLNKRRCAASSTGCPLCRKAGTHVWALLRAWKSNIKRLQRNFFSGKGKWTNCNWTLHLEKYFWVLEVKSCPLASTCCFLWR